MKTPQFLKSLWEKIKKQENAHSTETQNSSDNTHIDGQRLANQHYITAYEVQHRTAEQYYWKEQLRLAKRLNRLTKKLNCITIWGIAATFISLVLLGGTLLITMWNAQEDKRAWIGVGVVQILNNLTVGEPLRIRVGITNSGESPAIHAITSAFLDFLIRAEGDNRIPLSEDAKYSLCVEPKPEWGDTSGGVSILPGANVMILERPSPIVPEVFVKMFTRDNSTEIVGFQDLTDADRKAVNAMRKAPNTPQNITGIMGLYFVGCINYFDPFHIAHRTTFCFQYAYEKSFATDVPRGGFIPCEQGNDAD